MNNLGGLLADQGHLGAAIMALQYAAGLSPEEPEVCLNLKLLTDTIASELHRWRPYQFLY